MMEKRIPIGELELKCCVELLAQDDNRQLNELA